MSGMRYRLQRRQVVGGELADVFGFFKSPLNLEAITPPWLGFRVLHTTDAEVREGTRIKYGLRLHGIPFRWESRITEYRENEMFADEQITGPYRHWYHRHLFHQVPSMNAGRRPGSSPGFSAVTRAAWPSRMWWSIRCHSVHSGASRMQWRCGASSSGSSIIAPG